MKLVAALVVKNELGRYLKPCIDHLLEFVDEIRVLNDGSTDGSDEWLVNRDDRVFVSDLAGTTFFGHEGKTRQVLLSWTLLGKPTHVLSIDADELVADGPALRALLEADPTLPIVRLQMEEVWRASDSALLVREDGGWRAHRVPFVWRVPKRLDQRWRIPGRQLACGRVPAILHRFPASAHDGEISLLHFGWTDETNRAARHQRYVHADGGRFHRSAHLDSIMWPDEKVMLRERPWPAGEAFAQLRERLTAVAA